MRVFAVDLSLHTGWAFLEDQNVIDYGLIEAGKPKDFGKFPWNYLKIAKSQAKAIFSQIADRKPDLVVVEQTNKGQNRFSQKILEFLHFALLQELEWVYDVKYVDTSAWRKALDLKLTKEQRAANKLSKKKKKELGISGKVTPKHLAVEYCSKLLGKSFKLKDNDICDAICIGMAVANGCSFSLPT